MRHALHLRRSGHVAFGKDASVDRDPDSIIVAVREASNTQSTKHMIGISIATVWNPTSAPSSKNHVGIDTLIVPLPSAGQTFPACFGLSINIQRGGGAGFTGTVTEVFGIRINSPTVFDTNPTWVTAIGLDVQDWETNVNFGTNRRALLLANQNYIWGRNSGDTAEHRLIGRDEFDTVFIAADGQDIRWGRAALALGGGASATLGTIGGSGPTVAAQNEWVRIITAAGATRFIPVWA